MSDEDEVRTAVQRAQQMMRPYREPGRSLVDELIAEQRAEAGGLPDPTDPIG